MKKIINGLIITMLALLLLTACRPSPKLQAASRYRYTTQRVALRKHHKTVKLVKRNTRLKVIRSGKKWSKVQYKGKTYLSRKKFLHPERSPKKYSAREFRQAGVIYWHGYMFTWYTQMILPGGGLSIPGRHLDKNGFVCDKNDYIVVAITPADRRAHTIVATPFGKYGKCYDCGCGRSQWRDVYTNW